MDSKKSSLWSRFWSGVLTALFLLWVGAAWLFQDSDIAWIVFLPLFAAAPVVITFLLVRDALRRRRVNPLLAAMAPSTPIPSPWYVPEGMEAEPRSVVMAFLRGVEGDDPSEVYGLFHPDLRAAQGEQEFTKLVNRHSRLVHPTDYPSSRGNRRPRTYTESLKFKIQGGMEVTAKFRLVEQDDVWQIVGYRIEDRLNGFGGGVSP